MDPDVIKVLIEALAVSDLAELEYRSNGETLRLVKCGAGVPAPTRPPSAPDPDAVPASRQPPPSEAGDATPETMVAQLYGIVHLQQTSGAPPLVVPGQSVTAGQVLCIIEAMKVLNPVRAERDGLITAVLVQSGQEVEAGQPLFRLAEVNVPCSTQS